MADTSASGQPEGTVRRHVWVAALLSLAAFGLGQLYNGRLWWIVGLIAAWFALLALFHTDVPSSFAGFAIVFGGVLAVQVVAFLHSCATAWRSPVIARQPYHRWYAYAAYTVAINVLFLGVLSAQALQFGSPFGDYRPYRMTNSAMEPTLRPGEYFFVRLVDGEGRRALAESVGAIVVHTWLGEDNTPYVYRLVARAGQTLGVRGMDVVIDGKALPRNVLCSAAPESGADAIARATEGNDGKLYAVQHLDRERERDREDVAVPEDSFFVLGDFRDNSRDSRYQGAVHHEQLLGVALFIFWSDDWRRIGKSVTVDAPIPVRSDVCGEEPVP